MRLVLNLVFLYFGLLLSANAQSLPGRKTEARNLAREALSQISSKRYGEARKLLSSACSLDTSTYLYSYEIAYTHVLEKEYAKAVPFYKMACQKADATDFCYVMLGSCYFLMGQQEESVSVLMDGVKRFPNSGRIYKGLGDVNQWNLVKSLHFYEKGVQVDPSFAPNYYWLSKIFCNSTEEMWGLIYGEIYLNMEKNTPHAEEISRLLYSTYEEGIRFSGDTLVTVNFCRNSLTYPNEHKTEWLPLTMIYEPCLRASVRLGDTITLASLHEIRSRFVDVYFAENYHVSHPCLLFDWHKDLMRLGYFDCYNYWLLRYGSPAEFDRWLEKNRRRYEEFLEWLEKHPLFVEKGRQFHRFGR
ncbi:MAG: hypothetical protein J5554_14485 [Paludibacteraceae bacterium]|nr:hypothetical protein [Paludibacteraceae bacterium]